MDSSGVIYVLTNPSFPEYVKIGYADNVKKRLDQLNRTDCTPFAFKIYATLNVVNRLADKNIHKLIDKFKPELRSKENVNGKMRVREFFAMSPVEAYDLLSIIGEIFGEAPVLYSQSKADIEDEKIAITNTVEAERRSPFSFFSCGIKQGETIEYIHDSSIVCTVAGDRTIFFEGKTTSLSALAQKLLKRKSLVQGTLHFSYKGEMLSALRKRIEDEGHYGYQNPPSVHTESAIQKPVIISSNDDVLLYFSMKGIQATCRMTNQGYLLLKGSLVSAEIAKSCREPIVRLRQQYASSISDTLILLADIMFKSSSAAADFVSGMNLNGKICWKTADGVLLKELLGE